MAIVLIPTLGKKHLTAVQDKLVSIINAYFSYAYDTTNSYHGYARSLSHRTASLGNGGSTSELKQLVAADVAALISVSFSSDYINMSEVDVSVDADDPTACSVYVYLRVQDTTTLTSYSIPARSATIRNNVITA